MSQTVFSTELALWKAISVASRESDETFYQFGIAKDSLKEYEYVGWHGSDSGMTCIVKEDPFAEGQEVVTPVDATEFALATLEDPEMSQMWRNSLCTSGSVRSLKLLHLFEFTDVTVMNLAALTVSFTQWRG